MSRGGWHTTRKSDRYWSIGLARRTRFDGVPARAIAKAIERALDAAGAPPGVVPPRRTCGAPLVHGGRCKGPCAPGSKRCRRHWPGRYPLDTS